MSVEVSEGIPLDPVFLEEGDPFLESDLDHGVFALERLEFELFVNGLKLASKPLVKVLKNEWEKLAKEFKNLEVVFLDGHL